MRLFIAVDVGPGIEDAAASIIDELRRRVARAAPRARISWARKDRMHLTVRFIGEADALLEQAIRSALAPPLAIAAFDLTVAGTGCFPASGPPRVLWAGVTAGLKELQDVEREVRARFAHLPIPADDRGYNPHLTLARIRHPSGLQSSLLQGFAQTVFGTVRVEAVTLFESRLSPLGPAYVAHARTALRLV